jgi:uncharacterized damage-inducible protein DinB
MREACSGALEMNQKEYFLRMLAYDRWANRETLDALTKAGVSESKVLRLMAHTLSAGKLWLERLRREPQSMPVWPGSTVEECAALIDSVADGWQTYLSRLSSEDFNEKVEYRNSKGELWSSRVEDVLTHVFLHSAYHRGQIALQMRADGYAPANTDFIHAVRQLFVT